MVINKFFKYLFLLSIVLSISCGNDNLNQTPKPNHLLNRQEMAAVLCDIHLAEAAVTQKNYAPDSANMVNAGLYDFICKKHGVSKQDFEDSYHYYLSTPDELDSIYGLVVDTLTQWEIPFKGKSIEVQRDSSTKFEISVQKEK